MRWKILQFGLKLINCPLNVKKTSFIAFKLKAKCHKYKFDIKIDNVPITEVLQQNI